MDLTLNLPSNASEVVFPGNTLTSYRVLLQKYASVEVPHACALTALTMPTQWNNVKRGELFLVQVEKEAPIPADLLVPVEKKDGTRTSRSTELRRGGKISKLSRLIETASRRRPVPNMMRQRTATTKPAVALPQVSHQYPAIINVVPRKLPKKSKGLGADALKTREEVEEDEEEAEEEIEEEMESEDDAHTGMRDDGTGSSTSNKSLPAALTQIEKIAKKILKGERALHACHIRGRQSGNQQGPGSYPESAGCEETTSHTSQTEN